MAAYGEFSVAAVTRAIVGLRIAEESERADGRLPDERCSSIASVSQAATGRPFHATLSRKSVPSGAV
jgi:hypothetical protein